MAKILIIDDEVTIRELFRFVFEDAGHEVLLAGNGWQALDLLKAGVPDLMLVDVTMPEMNGRDFIAELKRRAALDARLANIPFVVMTGENYIDIELNGVFSSAPGFVCFFPKMTPPEKVLEKAEEVIG